MLRAVLFDWPPLSNIAVYIVSFNSRVLMANDRYSNTTDDTYHSSREYASHWQVSTRFDFGGIVCLILLIRIRRMTLIGNHMSTSRDLYVLS